MWRHESDLLSVDQFPAAAAIICLVPKQFIRVYTMLAGCGVKAKPERTIPTENSPNDIRILMMPYWVLKRDCIKQASKADTEVV